VRHPRLVWSRAPSRVGLVAAILKDASGAGFFGQVIYENDPPVVASRFCLLIPKSGRSPACCRCPRRPAKVDDQRRPDVGAG
jgi:hypothetical protein